MYVESATNKDISQWIREDEQANILLTPFDQQLTSPQRLTALIDVYRHSAAVMTCWKDYRKATPVLAQQTLPGALAYILLQEPNIRAEMSKADIGIPSHLATAAWNRDSRDTGAVATMKEMDAGAYAAAAPASYSQAQLERAVAEAVATAIKTHTSTKQLQYCWLHGYQKTHSGLLCHFIKKGLPLRAKYKDSRDDVPLTMVFDGPGCILVEQASEAAGPLTHPRFPGNTSKPGGQSQHNA